MKRAFDLLEEHKGIDLDLASIPAEDPATYAMIRKADTIGTFQIESRAQMSMLPRIKPRTFYDLVIEVAIVRPGPIQGDMVHPYLRRREGKEPVSSRGPSWRRCSARRLACRCSRSRRCRSPSVAPASPPGEADQLRRAMATFKFTGGVSKFQDKLIKGMVTQRLHAGIRRTHLPPARRLRQLRLSGDPRRRLRADCLRLGWMKCHHPDVFCAPS